MKNNDKIQETTNFIEASASGGGLSPDAGSRQLSSITLPDPEGPSTGSYCEIRGGGWNSQPNRCPSANRDYNPPAFSN